MVLISDVSLKFLWKGILAFLFILLSIALLITRNTPATGYESSIYLSTPLILWIIIIASVIVGTAFVVFTISKNELKKHHLWKAGLLLIFLCYAICLSLFIIRGYFMWCIDGDPASHIGWIKETINLSNIPSGLIYPVLHIYLSEIFLFSDLDLVILHKIIPFFFGLLCVLFMYVLGKTLFTRIDEAVLITVISCCLLFGWYINLTPNALSVLYTPFIFYLYIKYLHKKGYIWFIPLSIIIIIYPLFHIIPAILFGLVLLTFMIPTMLTEMMQNIHGKVKTYNYKIDVFLCAYPLLLLIIWLIFWISTFQIFNYAIRNIYSTIILEGKETKGMALLDQISYAQVHGYSVIEQVLKIYGAEAIIFSLSLLTLLLLWRDEKLRDTNKYLYSFFSPFAATLLMIICLFLFNLPFGPLRIIANLSILGVLFTAFFFCFILANNPSKKFQFVSKNITALFVTLIIATLFIMSMFILYPSPYNLGTSYHTTQSEVKGMSFFYDYRNTNVPITGFSAAPGRFSHALLSSEEQISQHLPLYFGDQKVPYHFGYDKHYSVSSIYTHETDLIITQKDRILYTEIFPDVAKYRFTPDDFNRIRYDRGVFSVYSNGEFDFFKVG